jgi:hypothetical protein
MKNPKRHHTIIAATALALGGIIPATFGGEKDPVVEKTPVSVAVADPVHIRINTSIVDPLNLQADRFSKFSRRMPTESTRYQLVENKKSVTGERSFKVVKISTPMLKGKKATTSDFLKVRYLENTSEMLVDLKDKWVKLEEHPVLKSLPKLKPVPAKIAP